MQDKDNIIEGEVAENSQNAANIDSADTSLDTDVEASMVDDERYSSPVHSTALWSLLSVLFSVLSIFLSVFYYVGIAFGVLGIVFAVISSLKLRYFDRMSIFGLVTGIFGAVFGTFALVLDVSGVLDALFLK